MPPLTLSLIICTRDRARDLEPTLAAALEALAGARKAWEVLVIDNGSSDGSGALAASLLAGRGRVVREEQQGLAQARNRGVLEAANEVLVFIDDDITTGAAWVSALEEAFEDPSVTAVGGPVETVFPPGSDRAFIDAVMADGGVGTGHYQPGGGRREVTGTKRYPRGGNMAIRRSALQLAHGFDVRLGWGKRQVPGEETDLFVRLEKAGARIWFVPEAVVLHRIQGEKLNWEYLRRWHQGYGRASILMRGRRGLLWKACKAFEQGFTWLRYGLIALLARRRTTARPWRKKWQAEGRLLELLGRD